MADRTCEDCGQVINGKQKRGRCETCYRRLLKQLKASREFTPSPYASSNNAFLTKVTPGWGGCWIFTGKIDRDGYGQVEFKGRNARAHRAACEVLVGPIPEDHELDHTCHSRDAKCPGGKSCIHRRCINPAHLEPVTQAENNRRSKSFGAVNALKTHCPAGHEYTPENTRWRSRASAGRPPSRACRTCEREQRRARYLRSK